MYKPKSTLSGATQMPRRRNGVLISAVLCCFAGVSACAINDDRAAFDGHQFRAKLSKEKKQREAFTVTVSEASKSLEGAREAGRFEATKYCIAVFGSSNVVWTNGPDVDDDALVIEKGKLELRGACAP